MKNHTLIWSIVVFLLFVTNLSAQVVYEKGKPYSFSSKSKAVVPLLVMPEINISKLQEQDAADSKGGQAPRFGVLHDVNYTLTNSGLWETLANGDRIWRLRIKAPDARTININYKKFDLPSGGKLFVYSSPKPTTVLGPFTSYNEKSNDRFATGFTYGSECIIEYYEPAAATGQGEIEIDGIVHGYRTIPKQTVDGFLKDFQGSGGCNYDVDCAISAGWEDQIKSVGMHILESGTRWCTGALISNTNNDCKPYFLTADHCFSVSAGTTLNDMFMFNYHSPTPACPGIPVSDGPTNQTVQGATVVANSSGSDFFLVELSVNPLNFYDVYYAGWSRETSGQTNSVAIHHPDSDVKKFSVDNDPPNSPNSQYWEVVWEEGTTEPGSSGSPLFDQNKRIIGQLCCGLASCNNPNESDDYGKVSYSWNSNGAAAGQQLAPWLDPTNTGAMFIDGTNCSVPMPPVAAFGPANNSPFSFCTNGTVAFTNQATGSPTSWSWTFSGAGVSPTTSNIENPTVTVTSSGTLTATLTVSNAQGTDTATQTYSVTVNPCNANTYCDSPNVSIPDNDASGISSTINIAPSSTIIDINVDVDITHTYIGDLEIQISHNGTTITILNQSGCFNENIDAVFDDEAIINASDKCNNAPAISGLVIPAQALTAFDGMDQTGSWIITVSDNADLDEGTINEWCLEITTATGATCYSMLTNLNGLNSAETGVADYESSDWIETFGSTTIQPGAQVDYDAVDYIQLNPGFEVKVNAIFDAIIDGCDNGGGGVNLINDSNSLETGTGEN